MLTNRQKMYYAMCRFGSTILLNVVLVATFWMYTNQVELDPILNGVGNAVGKLVIGISSVVFGYLSDSLSSSKARLGRRKLFIWTGAPILAFSFVMLFTPQFFIPDGGQTIKFIWLLAWNATFHLFYGYLLIPFQSWMPEITTEEERVQVSGLQNTVNLIGSAVGSGFVLIMSGFISKDPEGITGTAGTYLLIFALAFAVIEILFFLPALLKIKEKKIVHEKRKMFEEMKVALRNRNYMIWVGSFTILNVGVTLLTALLIDFLEKVLGVVSAMQKFLFGVSMFLVIIVSFIFWTRFSKRYGKKWSLIFSFSFLLLWMPLTPLVGRIPGIPPIVQGYVFGIVALFGMSSAYLFPYAILADFADADERKTAKNRSGMYTGFKSLPFNIAQAAGFILAGFLRGWSKERILGYAGDGFVGNWIDNVGETINIGLLWLGPIVTIFLFLAIPIIWQGDFDPFMKDEMVKKTSIFKQIFNKNNSK
ncbi:MAG: MFS transporter [Candidatus Heimdallarchaeota archaeon]|nr:MFS transporter [Candidatus Heimdallarchaeota archaeon]